MTFSITVIFSCSLQTGQMDGMGLAGPWTEALAGEPSPWAQLWGEEAS